ncbi:MAG: hypothetical protein AAF125_25955, partial [Chloroflexota bacterium]
ILHEVLSPEDVIDLLAKVSGPRNHEELGLSLPVVEDALRFSHHLRKRFTIMKLFDLLNIDRMVALNEQGT